MGDFRNEFSGLHKKLTDLEAAARKLQNQNLADVARSASGKLSQLLDHPDLRLLGADGQLDPSVNPDGTRNMPFDPKAGDGSTDQKNAGSDVGGPDRGKPDTHVPGEPRFDQPNQNFRQPNAVDLNPDGTIQQAPNSIGTKPDVRQPA